MSKDISNMPEGWKRLANAVVDMRKWEDKSPQANRVAIMEGHWCGDMATTLSLMKETAKALEISHRVIEENGLKIEVDPNYDLLGTVLSKWKDWK